MAVRVALFDHGMGNLRSVARALEAAGADVIVTSDPRQATGCDALCVPGQGIFGRCIDNLLALGGDDLVRSWIASERPFLGICLGMQVLFDASDEPASVGGGVECAGLGLLRGRVTRLPDSVTVPHIGWNTVAGQNGSGDLGTPFYFDHSYAVHPADRAIVAGWCEHGERFAALVRTGSILAVQFHPEKSGRDGIALLKRWLGERSDRLDDRAGKRSDRLDDRAGKT